MSAGGTEVEQTLACLATLFCAAQGMGNAVKDLGSRIRQNSGVWRESPKSGDFGYDVASLTK